MMIIIIIRRKLIVEIYSCILVNWNIWLCTNIMLCMYLVNWENLEIKCIRLR